jgi:hypothetical protein
VAVLITERIYEAGEAVAFGLDYEGLVLAVTSPFVTKRYVRPAADRGTEGE